MDWAFRASPKTVTKWVARYLVRCPAGLKFVAAPEPTPTGATLIERVIEVRRGRCRAT